MTRVFGNKTPELYNTVQQMLNDGFQTGDGAYSLLGFIRLSHIGAWKSRSELPEGFSKD